MKYRLLRLLITKCIRTTPILLTLPQIVFDVPQASSVNLSVYDLLGNKVAELVNGFQNAGRQSVNFDASKLSSGVYFYTLRSGATVITNKMILSK
ncbi:hypothetical protein MASR1M107_16410 [Ignavibacteriales bacterium]